MVTPKPLTRPSSLVLLVLHGALWLGVLLQRVHGLPPERDLQLLEVPPVLLVHQHEVEEEAHGEAVVDVAHGGHQREAGQEQAHRNRLAAYGRAVHDLETSKRFGFRYCCRP